MKKITTILALLMLTIYMGACAPANSVTAEPSDGTGTAMTSETPSSMETVSAGPVVTTENVDELIAMVNNFVTSGEITGQAENGLLAKLETIQQKLMDGQIAPSVNEMGAFVNEVQAQAGKKISEAAATALIAKAQAVAAELMAGVPVTGGEGTAVPVTSQPTDSTVGNISTPAPMGDQLEHQGDVEDGPRCDDQQHAPQLARPAPAVPPRGVGVPQHHREAADEDDDAEQLEREQEGIERCLIGQVAEHRLRRQQPANQQRHDCDRCDPRRAIGPQVALLESQLRLVLAPHERPRVQPVKPRDSLLIEVAREALLSPGAAPALREIARESK